MNRHDLSSRHSRGSPSCIYWSLSCLGIDRSKTSEDQDESSAFSVSSMDEFVSQVLPENASSLIFTLDELKKATLNFSPSCKIGQGGFGIVYKGRLTNGTEVAVKRARKDIFEARLTLQFQIEVNLLASVEHLNLVKLLGYFDGGDERILVQEYVPNGNLRQHLDCEFGVVLDLAVRLDIAIDIAHALTYLHLYAERPIIHRDVKASNILLTRNFRAKVADFGFARVMSLDSDATYVSTQVKGTAGYLDPEYLKSYQLSPKSDVYSFGILLIELVTGRRPIEASKVLAERITARWAFKNFLNNNIADVLDPKLEKSEAAYLVAEKVSELAFQCSAPTRFWWSHRSFWPFQDVSDVVPQLIFVSNFVSPFKGSQLPWPLAHWTLTLFTSHQTSIHRTRCCSYLASSLLCTHI